MVFTSVYLTDEKICIGHASSTIFIIFAVSVLVWAKDMSAPLSGFWVWPWPDCPPPGSASGHLQSGI